MHDDVPLQFKADLALWSIGVLIIPLVLVIAIVCWYKKRPAFPVALFSIGILIGLFTWPLLAIVCSILLTGFVVSASLRSPSITKNDASGFRQLP